MGRLRWGTAFSVRLLLGVLVYSCNPIPLASAFIAFISFYSISSSEGKETVLPKNKPGSA